MNDENAQRMTAKSNQRPREHVIPFVIATLAEQANYLRDRGDESAASALADCIAELRKLDAQPAHESGEGLWSWWLPPGWKATPTRQHPERYTFYGSNGCVAVVRRNSVGFWEACDFDAFAVKLPPNCTRDEAMRRATGDAKAREGGGRG